MHVLHYWPGYCSLATHIVLRWIGVEFELVKAGLTRRQSIEFQALNPSSTVPVLVTDEGWTLSQNVAILNYLADRYPQVHLNGDDSLRGRAEVNRWLGYINSDVHKAFSPLMHPERIIGGETVAAATLSAAREALRRHFNILDQALSRSLWIAGDDRSIADPYLFVLTRWALATGVEIADLSTLAQHYQRMRADPGVVAALAAEQLKDSKLAAWPDAADSTSDAK